MVGGDEGDENNTMVGGDEGDEGDENNTMAPIFPNLGMRQPAGAVAVSTIAGAGDGPVAGSAVTAGTNPRGQAAPAPSRIDQAYNAITLALQGTDMDPEVCTLFSVLFSYHIKYLPPILLP